VNVKVCGVTRPEDASLAVELGASLVGLNFWPGSPRALDLARGRAVADAVRGRALLVGVFVDQDPRFVSRALDEVGLDLVQLHGEEGAAEAAPFAARAIKAFRCGAAFDPALAAPFDGCWGFLLDAAHDRLHGGTGEPWPWERVSGALPGRRVLLAGGVAPGRVRALAERCRGSAAALPAARPALPWGLDVCSGVERAPGIKDEHKLRALFSEVRDVEIATVA
jgi:phosphoribosylanthranilate isomerase